MGKLNLSQQALAQVKSFASRGVAEAAMVSAMMDGTKVIDFTIGAEAANAINVAGQVKDWDGSPIAAVTDILIESTPVAGAGTVAIGAVGTSAVGDASVKNWIKTDATGAFDVDVTNINAEENHLRFSLDDGQTEIEILTFA